MNTITIKDIARELGYSISTVSRALQNHPDISEETKRAVVAYAREHHYRPNQLASSLRTQKNTTIGLVLPDLSDYFFSTILVGVEKAANAAGYNVLITRTKNDPERERQCLHMMLNSRVAGIIACPTRSTTDFSPFTDLLESGMPLVLVDRLSPVPCDQVVSDDFAGAYRAVEYLIETGCRRIAIFSSVFETHAIRERERGYQEALRRYGLHVEDKLQVRCSSREDAILQASNLLSVEPRLDAVFCVSDSLANGVVYVAKMKHVSVPDEVAVCGFSNDVLTAHTDPMQTTVEQQGRVIGRVAMQHLLARIEHEGGELPAETTVVPTQLVVRETTK